MERPSSEFMAWKEFLNSPSDARADALLSLYMNLDSLSADESIEAGFAAFERLLDEHRYQQAAFVARSLGTELIMLERFDEAAELVNKALNCSLWLSDVEVGLLYYVNGRNLLSQKMFAEAEIVLERAVCILEIENERLAGFALKELAEVTLELGKADEAIRSFASSITLLENSAEAASVGHVKRRLGEAFLSQRQFWMAEKLLMDAIAILTFLDLGEEKREAELALGCLQIEIGNFKSAEQILSSITQVDGEVTNVSIAARASYFLLKIRFDSDGIVPTKGELDSLRAVLLSAGLIDLAESVGEFARAKNKVDTKTELTPRAKSHRKPLSK